MKQLLVALLLLSSASPVWAQRRNAPLPLRLALETKLGVKEELLVAATDAPTTLLDAVSFGGLSAHGRSRLVLQAPDSVYLMIPWALVKEGVANQSGHTIHLTDGTQVVGKVATEVSAAPDSRRYNLDGAARFTVLSAPKSETLNWGGVDPWPPRLPWTLTIASRPEKLEVSAAHFVFRYYSTAGYVVGGSDGNVWQALNFTVKVDNERIGGNLPDFEAVSVRRRGGRDSVTVQAPGASSVSGELVLSQSDSRGPHDAYPDWILLVTLPNGVDMGLTGRDWDLVRRRSPGTRGSTG